MVIESAPAFANSSTWRSGRSIMRCTSAKPPASWIWPAIASSTSGPIVIGGTKWPSITSMWMTRAPASMTLAIWSASRAKSAERIEGATCGRANSSSLTRTDANARNQVAVRGRALRARPRHPHRNRALLLVAVGRRLLLLLRRVVLRLRIRPHDDLARPVRVVRGRVDDHVLLVEQGAVVVAGAAIDVVGLAVASVDRVVAVAAVDGVGVRVRSGRRVDVRARERPQVVVAAVAIELVDSGVREHPVAPRTAVLDVVVEAAGDAVVALAAIHGVVAEAAEQHVVVRPAVDGVVARGAEHEVVAPAGVQVVVAAGSVHEIVAAVAVHHVVAEPRAHAVAALAAVDEVVARVRAHDVAAAVGDDRVVVGRASQHVAVVVVDDRCRRRRRRRRRGGCEHARARDRPGEDGRYANPSH